MSFISITCLTSPLLQLLPKGCCACCCALLNSFYHPVPGDKLLYCPTCDPTGLIFLSSIPRYSQCHTYLFAIHGADSYYSSTWAHCSFHMGLLEKCPTQYSQLECCTGAAFWSWSHRKGPCCAGCCTYKSVGHRKQVFYSILLSDYFRQGRLQQFSSKALVCHNQQQSQAQQENLPRLLFQRLQNLPIFPLLFRFSSSTTKVNVYTRREKRLVFTQKASSNTFSFSFSFGTSRGGG